uniref:Uncharacterized protein n=1 Tax=Timema cristinae TaxID=61476 RepID=A0A7R9C8U5_TIMCR|nr:unnamed protein product [Timema cristinae]
MTVVVDILVGRASYNLFSSPRAMSSLDVCATSHLTASHIPSTRPPAGCPSVCLPVCLEAEKTIAIEVRDKMMCGWSDLSHRYKPPPGCHLSHPLYLAIFPSRGQGQGDQHCPRAVARLNTRYVNSCKIDTGDGERLCDSKKADVCDDLSLASSPTQAECQYMNLPDQSSANNITIFNCSPPLPHQMDGCSVLRQVLDQYWTSRLVLVCRIFNQLLDSYHWSENPILSITITSQDSVESLHGKDVRLVDSGVLWAAAKRICTNYANDFYGIRRLNVAEVCPHMRERRVENYFGKPLSVNPTGIRTLNFPVICCLIHHKCDSLDHAATEAGNHPVSHNSRHQLPAVAPRPRGAVTRPTSLDIYSLRRSKKLIPAETIEVNITASRTKEELFTGLFLGEVTF